MIDRFDIPDHIEQTILDSKKVAFTQAIGGEFMRHYAKFSEERDLLTGRMIAHLSTYVRSHNLPPEKVTETRTTESAHPASWWQMWKQDVAANTRGLRWIVNRWPARTVTRLHTLTVTVDLRRFRLYPDAPNIGDLDGFTLNVAHHDLTVFAKWSTDIRDILEGDRT